MKDMGRRRFDSPDIPASRFCSCDIYPRAKIRAHIFFSLCLERRLETADGSCMLGPANQPSQTSLGLTPTREPDRPNGNGVLCARDQVMSGNFESCCRWSVAIVQSDCGLRTRKVRDDATIKPFMFTRIPLNRTRQVHKYRQCPRCGRISIMSAACPAPAA